MLRKDEILDVLEEWNYWQKNVDTDLFPRDDYIKKIKELLKTKEVVVLKGVRRSGKSTLLKLLIKELQQEISKKQILLVNFEDPRFYPHLGLELLEEIFETYRTFVNPNGKCYILLDEIHYVEAWEKWVRKQRDLHPNEVKILVTGSSSRLLDTEYSTALTGRTLPITVFPLSFKEYLLFSGVKLGDVCGMRLKRQIKAQLEKYMTVGGFPEMLLTGKQTLVQSYFDDILYKDIVDRFAVRDTKMMKRVAHFLLTNVSNEYTYNSLRKMIGSSMDLVRQYIGYIESSYLIYSVNMFSFSLKEQNVNPRKVYCIDNGLRNIVGFKFSEDYGKLYENTVFLELKKTLDGSPLEIYYWKNESGKEVDFIVRHGMKTTAAIQVCWDMRNENTKKREVDALLDAMKEFKLKKGLIITESSEGEESFDDKVVEYVPLWKWLVDSKYMQLSV
ncbi:MAG: ATP-binding protein [Candidatus Aenigmatarchaeota archaeon]